MGFPELRLRRLRQHKGIRTMLDRPWPVPQKFIWPIFCLPEKKSRQAIASMPGQFRLGQEALLKEVQAVAEQGIGGILLFGIADQNEKDAQGLAAYREDGVVPQAIRAIKANFPQIPIFTDVCLCAYTTHGHCGPLNQNGQVENDATLKILAETALCHAQAGADVLAPSAMMDGQVKAIRQKLDSAGFQDKLIMSYSTKFASSLYGPFRDAENSSPGSGDRKGYQQSYGSKSQAIRESLEDENEGADILMVKPALWYLDILSKIRQETLLPLAAYNVSGEYSMLHATARRGWGELIPMVQESLSAIERSGVELIISYWARYYSDYFPQVGP